jgi:hypothetical protein
LVAEGVDPLFALAIFRHESGFATNPAAIVVQYGTKNPGNTRTSRTGINSGSVTTPRGVFVKYATWADGWRDIARRLNDPGFVYAQRGAKTPGTIIPIYAPAADSNDPSGYIAAVVSDMITGAEVIPPQGGNLNIVDLRGQLYTNPNGGPNATSPKNGAIVHYNGPPPNPDAVTQYTNDAVYHANKDWGSGNFGDGIMYHYGIGGDGTVYQLRNENATLWHCGSWPENATYTAINVNIGDGQHASAEQLSSLADLLAFLEARDGFGRDSVKGHQEVSPTACPGSLMADFVLPYRNGTIVITPPPVIDERTEFPTHKILRKGNGFRNQWDAIGSLGNASNMRLLGYPVTDEYVMRFAAAPDKDRTVQLFERGGLTWEGGISPPWDITALTLAQSAEAVAEAIKRAILYTP